MAEVFYRKWRPKSLSEVVGQEAITKTLRQAVAQGRIAHAYLFCGTRGTGKTSTARILAKAINCQSPRNGEPDNECRICVSINEGRSLDLIEIDAASNRGIDDIRELSDKVRFSPSESRCKIYIIDEVHMLTEPAFNALLKTLEEPPAHAIFILATTEAHKVPLTIISRCQRYDFRRIPIDQMVAKLADISRQEGIEASTDALALIARMANGGLRDAENLLEQVVVSYGAAVNEDDVRQLLGLGGDAMALELAAHIIGRSVRDGIAAVNGASERGTDLRQLLRGTLEYMRALLLIKTGAGANFGYSDEIAARLNALAESAPMDHLVRSLKVFAGVNMRRDAASTLPLELAIVESAAEPPPLARQPAAAPPAYAASQQPAYAPQRQPAPARQAPPSYPAQQPAAQQPYRQPARPAAHRPAPDMASAPNAAAAVSNAPNGTPAGIGAPNGTPNGANVSNAPAGIGSPNGAPNGANVSNAPAGSPNNGAPNNGRPNNGASNGENPAARLDYYWNRIAHELRFVGARFKLGALLRSSREREVAGDTIILKYASRSNGERLQQELDNPESRRALQDEIAKAMGAKYDIRVALSNGANGGGAKRASQTSHLVQAAMAMGARVTGEREERQ